MSARSLSFLIVLRLLQLRFQMWFVFTAFIGSCLCGVEGHVRVEDVWLGT